MLVEKNLFNKLEEFDYNYSTSKKLLEQLHQQNDIDGVRVLLDETKKLSDERISRLEDFAKESRLIEMRQTSQVCLKFLEQYQAIFKNTTSTTTY